MNEHIRETTALGKIPLHNYMGRPWHCIQGSCSSAEAEVLSMKPFYWHFALLIALGMHDQFHNWIMELLVVGHNAQHINTGIISA